VSERRTLEAIPGHAPAPGRRPPGCAFAARCSHTTAMCDDLPPLAGTTGDHLVSCWRAETRHESGPVEFIVQPPRRLPVAEPPVLEVTDLHVNLDGTPILNGVSLQVPRQGCLAVVGESGSGKTTLARAVMGLAAVTSGTITYHGDGLPGRPRERTEQDRRTLQYIFQSPTNSLNPRRTVGQLIGTPIKHFFELTRRERSERVAEVLDLVSLPSHVASVRPGQLSGGERQRVAIARALAAKPDVLVCDEITSALDVSVQAGIVRLLEDLVAQERISLMFITHNLGLVRTMADDVVVIKAGRVVESGDADTVVSRPADPYTRQLVADTPSPGEYPSVAENSRLQLRSASPSV
jgi:peptide/nickel transport system ATP-binding protein